MTDVADLRIRVESLEAAVAEKRLDRLAASGGRAERATDGLTRHVARLAGTLAVGATALAGFSKLLNTQRQFDVINAGLVTATGSAESAQVAFSALQDFATATPYSLQQVSDAFVKLVNYGLTPSERALTSYGDTSAALGKDLMMLVEAVADASAGEFERLKEFGIKARKEGDQVRLTFRGVTETVGASASEIEDYLIRLGEQNFAGNMEARMRSLDGALSNLGDEWDKLFLSVSDAGVGDAIADAVRVGVEALAGITEWIEGGELQGSIAGLAASWQPFIDETLHALDAFTGTLDAMVDNANARNPEIAGILSSAWTDFPANVRASVQAAAAAVGWFVERMRIGMEAVEGYQEAINDGWGGRQIADVYREAQAASERNNANLKQSIDLYLGERQATLDSAAAAKAAAIERAAATRRELEERKRALAEGGGLGSFGLGAGGDAGGAAEQSAADAARRQKAFEDLVADLRTEEEALADSYSVRRALIEGHTAAESDLRKQLMERLDAWRDQIASAIQEDQGREVEQLRQSLLTEEEAIRESYERRRQIALDNMPEGAERDEALRRLAEQRDDDLAREQEYRQARRDRLMQDFLTEEDMLRQSRDRQMEEQERGYEQQLISWEEFQRNKAEIERRYLEGSEQLQRDQAAQALQAYGGMVGGVSELLDTLAKGQGKGAERMFKVAKALNMAQAIMATAAGIMEAQRSEPNQYLRIAEQIRIAALGAVQVATIASQRFAGAYDAGGRIPAGQVGIVGERGMELVEGPANVTGREDTARLLRRAAEGGSSGGDVTVNIQVNVDQGGRTTTESSVQGEGATARDAYRLGKLIDERARDVILKEQRQGGLLSRNR